MAEPRARGFAGTLTLQLVQLLRRTLRIRPEPLRDGPSRASGALTTSARRGGGPRRARGSGSRPRGRRRGGPRSRVSVFIDTRAFLRASNPGRPRGGVMVDAGASPRMYAPILDSTGMNRDRVGATRVEGDRPSSLASPRSILRRAAGDLGEARAPYRVVGDLDGELDGDPDGDPGGREMSAGSARVTRISASSASASSARASSASARSSSSRPDSDSGSRAVCFLAGFDRQTSRRTTVPPSSVSPLWRRIPSRTSRRRTPTTARRRSERSRSLSLSRRRLRLRRRRSSIGE